MLLRVEVRNKKGDTIAISEMTDEKAAHKEIAEAVKAKNYYTLFQTNDPEAELGRYNFRNRKKRS